jgi:hypothetical protein
MLPGAKVAGRRLAARSNWCQMGSDARVKFATGVRGAAAPFKGKAARGRGDPRC